MRGNFYTRAILIKIRDFNEKDKVAIFYTKEYGKLQVICKGARNFKSKFMGFLNFLDIVDLEIYKGENNNYLNSISLVSSGDELRSDLELINQISGLFSFIYYAFAEEEEDEYLFNLLIDCFATYNGCPNLSVNALKLKFLKQLGSVPKFDLCTVCNKPVNQQLQNFLSSNLELVCGSVHCLAKTHKGLVLKPNIIRVYNFLLNSNFSDIVRLNISRELELNLNEITNTLFSSSQDL